jgi:hypothetical protein
MPSWMMRAHILEYDLNSNVSLAGMPRGPAVWVMCLADLFPYWTTVRLSYIYTSCKTHRKNRRLIVFSTFCKLLPYSEDHRLALVVFPARVFHVKKSVFRVRSLFAYNRRHEQHHPALFYAENVLAVVEETHQMNTSSPPPCPLQAWISYGQSVWTIIVQIQQFS